MAPSCLGLQTPGYSTATKKQAMPAWLFAETQAPQSTRLGGKSVPSLSGRAWRCRLRWRSNLPFQETLEEWQLKSKVKAALVGSTLPSLLRTSDGYYDAEGRRGDGTLSCTLLLRCQAGGTSQGRKPACRLLRVSPLAVRPLEPSGATAPRHVCRRGGGDGRGVPGAGSSD